MQKKMHMVFLTTAAAALVPLQHHSLPRSAPPRAHRLNLIAQSREPHARLILVRHGQSEWNRANLFTGWVDVDLTEQGISEAREVGRLIAAEGLHVRSEERV